MFRRLLWMVAGAAFGIAAARWVSRTRERVSAPGIARTASRRLDGVVDRIAAAVAEGREAMAERESELRTSLGLPPS